MQITIRACDRCPAPTPGEVPESCEEFVYSFDGKRWILDLCQNHGREFKRMWEAMSSYTQSSRVAPVNKATSHTTQPRRERHRDPEAEKIRQWAIDHGHEVGQKGRISAELRGMYEDAHRDRPTPLVVPPRAI